MLFITHNLGVICKVADDLCVMQSGQIVEEGPVKKTPDLISRIYKPLAEQYLVPKNFS